MTSEREPGDSHVGNPYTLYLSELRLSLLNNAGAYGYSVMITASVAVLTSIYRSPDIAQVFLFLLGALLSFAAVELLATRGFTRPINEHEATKVIALGSALNLVSVSLAVGAAVLGALLLPKTVGWTACGFLASLIYLLATATEMSFARRIQELRRRD